MAAKECFYRDEDEKIEYLFLACPSAQFLAGCIPDTEFTNTQLVSFKNIS
jgi:hypothetical protein